MVAIACHNVRRVFDDTVALNDVTLTIDSHQIFGLLGTNSSGKTTLLNLIQGLDTPTSGSVEVLGLDPIRNHDELVRRLGSQHQEATSIPRLTVRETISLFASFYPTTSDVDKLIDSLTLTDKKDSRLEKLSGGQRQRVFIALAMIHNPELLLFDELTSALDPNIKRSIWDILKRLREDGRTILLTTHSMAEAEELCDKVAIIDDGSILAVGSPEELIAKYAPELTLHIPAKIAPAREELEKTDGTSGVSRVGSYWKITGDQQMADQVMSMMISSGRSASEVHITQASLEDVFAHLTGRHEMEVNG